MKCPDVTNAESWAQNTFCSGSPIALALLVALFVVATGTVAGALLKADIPPFWEDLFGLWESVSKIIGALVGIIALAVPLVGYAGWSATVVAADLSIVIVIISIVICGGWLKYRRNTGVSASPKLIEIVDKAERLARKGSQLSNSAPTGSAGSLQLEIRDLSRELRDEAKAFELDYRQLTGLKR